MINTPSATPVVTDSTLPKPDRPRPLLGYGAAWIGEEEKALLCQVVDHKAPFRYYGATKETSPPMAATLERELAELVGTRFALAVTSGTAALETALGALGVGPGDEVILPAWSWVSCFTAVVRLGAKPVLAEISDTFCIHPTEIDRLATPRTKAVLVVHYQGVVAEMDEIMEAARRRGIAVLEDCAECFGATYRGRSAGSIGDIGIFSFQYNKILSSGEGGAVVTSDPRLYERAVRMHDLGMYRKSHESWTPPACEPFCGGQYRMNEFTAAVALAQLRKLPAIVAHCRALTGLIREAVAGLPGVRMRRVPDPAGEVPIETYFWPRRAGDAAKLREFLHARGVHCQQITGTYCQYRRGYCLNRSNAQGVIPQFAEAEEWPAEGYRAIDFPQTEELTRDFVAIPVGCYFTPEDAAHVVDALRDAAETLLSQEQ